MTTPRDPKSLSALISLTMLAIGFTLLGLLALANQRQEDMAGATILENNCCVIGSILSIVAGAIFMVSGWIYWNRSVAFARSQINKDQGKAEKDKDAPPRPLTLKAIRQRFQSFTGRTLYRKTHLCRPTQMVTVTFPQYSDESESRESK